MRALTIVTTLVVIATVPLPATAQHCEILNCWRECQWVPGRGHCCRTLCRKRCFRPALRYEPPVREPEQQYQPRFVAPVQQRQPAPPPRTIDQRPDASALFLALGGIAILVLLGAAIFHGEVSKLNKATDATEHETAATRALTAKLEAAAREADSHIAALLERGRRDGTSRHD